VEGDVTYVAVYEPNTDTQYKVMHYIENLDGSYRLVEISTMW
jgi:hypothetical protein